MSDRPSNRNAAHWIRLPLLDRLIADADDDSAMPRSPQEAVEALRKAVRRDLEALLNARRRRWPLPETAPELITSPLNYGIPDATSGSYALQEKREALAAEVEATIRRYEPRLRGVKVRIDDSGGDLERRLKLRVDAVLRSDPVPEPVSFETVIEAVSHEVRVADQG
ncbi:type VI secretion system baseplate subunit TssE [Rhodovarius crocodyli]|uniref:Type VI secretion system baseplate subunit TssE n=1 Tax=Rhodovarius crocodyli TaxID=1979269 RepID=A0A437MME3_9PROT|nr:type VI secretion system baseplate subunit TssE [Rhodovarius crocodyli]RVT98824.1 type VI secretion system baseplate subunit TssE [Rhodovarius crocodyli]